MEITSFPPDAPHDYALPANGERALVAPRGAMAWLYAPTWHNDDAFASLIGGRAATPSPPLHVPLPPRRPAPGRSRGRLPAVRARHGAGRTTAGPRDRCELPFERDRGACGASGLYAEEFDVAQRHLRGNLPQAFVHALLLETTARLAHDPEPGGARRQKGS